MCTAHCGAWLDSEWTTLMTSGERPAERAGSGQPMSGAEPSTSVPTDRPLRGLSSMATRDVLAALARAWRDQQAGEVEFESVGGVDAARRVASGEPFDVVVLAADVIDGLIAAGSVRAGSRTDLVRSEVAVAVRRGAPRPAIDSAAALRQAVLAAVGVGYSTGPSGVAILQLLDRWGIADAMRGRLAQARPGVPVASLLASGQVDLGFQQRSELMHVEGVDVLGPMPPGLEIVTTFAGGICTTASRPDEVRALLAFCRSPTAAAIIRRHAMQPAD